MPGRKTIFVSSVQKDLAVERRALKDYIHGDPLVGQFFNVFFFEDLPVTDRRADEVYLAEVDRCAIYLGLFGQDYGFEDAAGVSPTDHEFDRATTAGKPRFIYVRGADDSNRHPKLRANLGDGEKRERALRGVAARGEEGMGGDRTRTGWRTRYRTSHLPSSSSGQIVRFQAFRGVGGSASARPRESSAPKASVT